MYSRIGHVCRWHSDRSVRRPKIKPAKRRLNFWLERTDWLGRLCRHCAAFVSAQTMQGLFLLTHSRTCHAKADDVSNQTGATKPILKRTTRVRLNIGWSARIRTMIKRTKISCPTIRRRSKDRLYYI